MKEHTDYLPFDTVMRELESGNPPHLDAGFLGARLDPREARLQLIPVPWEATTSYGGGTAAAPDAIRRASHQLDLEDAVFGAPYRAGIAMLPEDAEIRVLNRDARSAARRVIEALEHGGEAPADLARVNAVSERVNALVDSAASAALADGRLVGLVGGDHASPYGLIHALARGDDGPFGILHIDAHHDLRAAYEGFTWSHASIFHNVMRTLPAITRLVQVGIRDYSRAERQYCEQLGERARCFYADDLFRRRADGQPWAEVTRAILAELPPRVYVSFDIDGLDQPWCPHTGTPVPGGLSYAEAVYLIEELATSGRRIIGFDLCEVAPGPEGDEWDANVGARLLYKLCGCVLRSHGLC